MSDKVVRQGGYYVRLNVFKRKFLVYEAIGSEIEVRSEQRARSWRRLWLGRRYVKVKASSIVLRNRYVTDLRKIGSKPEDFPGSEFVVGPDFVTFDEEQTWRDASDAQMTSRGFNAAVKLGEGGAKPGKPLGDALPVDGLHAVATVVVGSEVIEIAKSTGFLRGEPPACRSRPARRPRAR
jgi:hypothetical protein